MVPGAADHLGARAVAITRRAGQGDDGEMKPAERHAMPGHVGLRVAVCSSGGRTVAAGLVVDARVASCTSCAVKPAMNPAVD